MDNTSAIEYVRITCYAIMIACLVYLSLRQGARGSYAGGVAFLSVAFYLTFVIFGILLEARIGPISVDLTRVILTVPSIIGGISFPIYVYDTWKRDKKEQSHVSRITFREVDEIRERANSRAEGADRSDHRNNGAVAGFSLGGRRWSGS